MNHGRAKICRTVVLAWLIDWRSKVILSNKLRWLFLHLLQDINLHLEILLETETCRLVQVILI
ncbi:hypothetical protein BT93_A0753 [Corymbia citriodora subsp. variegata]|nr:hypothetical protein BT93_A0753 [Corymbia citriodora subsp. variegata]